MKKILLPLLLIASTGLYTQELDEAYLASLPENVRNDVLEKMTDSEELEKPSYRRPSLMISKNYCTGSDTDTVDCIPESTRFGSNFFDMMQSSFMPINEPNFDSSYVLDFGDTLEIQLIGQQNSIDKMPIKRDGSVNVPEIGKLFVSGLTLEAANEMIKSRVSNAYIGIEAFVSLVNIRDIQVLITGNAYNPGIYTLNGNSNVLHALSMAGGIDENGSYRQIQLIRNDKVISSIDLYDIFIYGKSGFGQRLRSGDSILIKPSNKQINLTGAIKRPGSYELLPDETFLDLFNFGNGFADSADINTLRIERLNKANVDLIIVKNANDLVNFNPVSGDSLNVRKYERKRVSISGAIKTPGTYIITEGETLSSLINKAEGYKDDAYPFGSILNNIEARIINEKATEKLYKAYIQKLITKGDALFASESLPFILEELKQATITGRVMAEFDLDVIKANPNLDTKLDDGDEIIIPTITQQVYIFGEVNNAGATRYQAGNKLNEYLINTGGLLQSADKSNIFIVHPNGEVNRTKTQTFGLSFLNKRSNEVLIYPGSVIYVPRKVASRDLSVVASIWAPIVSATATSITALTVLGNND
jgi:protein involved in polysaccharide export with SLBB domain